jgi:hypothetical protein
VNLHPGNKKLVPFRLMRSKIPQDMNPDLIADKNPFSTGELLIMLVTGMLLANGTVHPVLKKRK